jgi:hypothetical protein
LSNKSSISTTSTNGSKVIERAYSKNKDSISDYAKKMREGVLDGKIYDHICTQHRSDDIEAFKNIKARWDVQRFTKTSKLLKNPNKELSDYLMRFQHVVIDEAQDVVGTRAELVMNLIQNISDEAGVTIFGDPVQAIYDFTVEKVKDKENLNSNHSNLLELIKRGGANLRGNWIMDLELKENYRLKNEDLSSPLYKLRDLISGSTREADYKQAYDLLKTIKSKQNSGDKFSSKFLLYRKRVDVLTKASYLYQEKIKHKIRLGNLPTAINPWIGVFFFDYNKKRISKEGFKKLFETKKKKYKEHYFFKGLKVNQCWNFLRNLAIDENDKYVVIKDLRRVLLYPPAEACITQYGVAGDTISTIHAAKGLEADSVHFILPPYSTKSDFAFDEEGRVLYVAATRASKDLHVEIGGDNRSKSSEQGRAYKRLRKGVQVEIGIKDDFIPVSVLFTGTELRDQEMVHKLQEHLINSCESFEYYRAERESRDRTFRVFVNFVENERKIGYYIGDFSDSFYWDLKAISNSIAYGRGGAGHSLNYVRSYGIATGVVPFEDVSKYNHLPHDFQENGFYVYPILRGFSVMEVKRFKG